MPRFRGLVVACLSAALAMGAIGASTAQAGQPEQPLFTSAGTSGRVGESIKSGLTIEGQSGAMRLWVDAQKVVIACRRSTSRGTIEPKGRDSSEITLKECAAYESSENSANQWQEGAQLSCEIEDLNPKTPNKNEIMTKPLRSRLVFGRGGTTNSEEVYDRSEPATGTVFTEFEFKGASCILKSIKLKLEGSVLGRTPRLEEEDIVNGIGWEVENAINKNVVQRPIEWEIEEPGASSPEKGSAELLLKEGEKVSAAALEGVEQLELSKVGGHKGLFGVGNLLVNLIPNPNPINFHKVKKESTSEISVKVKNWGLFTSEKLAPAIVETPEANIFTKNGDTCEKKELLFIRLVGWNECEIGVRFRPAAAVSYTGALKIENEAKNHIYLRVDISGMGLP